MSNHQPPPSNNNNQRPGAGGPLSNYGPPRPLQGAGGAGSPAPGQFQDIHSSPTRALLSNTRRMMREWTGKLATVAGHTEQPPAPYLERYRTSVEEVPVTSHYQPWRRSRAVRITTQMRNRRERWRRSHPNVNRVLSGIVIAIAVLMVILGSGGVAYGYTYYEGQLPRLQEIASQTMTQSTRIYDRSGALLFEVFDTNESNAQRGRRTPVSYNDIPKVLQDALIAIEDDTFWTNTGISPVGLVRAAVASGSGGEVQGASTIAQQVIKNMTNEKEQSLARKIPEAALAIGLTQEYPKWKILEMYFNISPFGPLDMGVESAVQEYFNIQPQCTKDFQNRQYSCTPAVKFLNKDLTKCQEQDKTKCPDDPLLGLARGSLLAGLPQNPTIYYPAGGETNKKSALLRQKLVLNRMVDLKMSVAGLGVVTPAIARQVEDLTAKMTFTRYTNAKRAPHFVDWIINQVETILGNGDPNKGVYAFLTGGFNIRTTISADLEDYVERTVKKHLTGSPSLDTYDGLPLNTGHNANNSAVVVMNSHTGEILAMNGSVDYNDPTADPRINGQFNAAADGTGRQTGSSFKPIVYATAFEMGWYPGMAIPDYRTYFPNENQGVGTPAPQTEAEAGSGDYLYAPHDYNSANVWNYSANKPSTVRLALQESQNVGAVKALKFAGPKNVENMAHRLGLTGIQAAGNGLAWALGTQNSTVLQMTDAYQTFANGGQRVPPQGILDIWDNYGRNLYHYDTTKPPTISVISPQVAYLMTSVLIDEPSRINEFGIYHTLSFSDLDDTCRVDYKACPYPVATKTGTTNDFKDTWTVGYTPGVVVGAWTGNSNNESMDNILGISGAGTIWHSVIKAANGYCGQGSTYYENGVECPPSNLVQTLGTSTDRTFTVPDHIIETSVSSGDGLAGSGTYDYMIDSEQPMQSGGGSGN
jgi:membrane peptidoglycan carboxypeptidase